jgi:CheY-like chemotaxis protein/signal transduction histidine kinase
MPSPRLLALAAAGFGLPAWVALVPGGIALLATPSSGIVLATALIAAPAAAAVAASWRGLLRLAATPADSEPSRAVGRVLLAAAMLAYAVGLGAVTPFREAAIGCVVVAALGLACAWLFLLHAIVAPARSAIRRAVAIAVDVGLVSAFLHAGDFLTAAWSAAYLIVAIRDGGNWPAVAAALGGFAIVVTTTAFWWGQPLLSFGTAAAIVLVPAYVGALLRRAAASAAASAGQAAARTRLYAALGSGVRDSLKALLRAGARLDRTDLSPQEAEIIARMRLSARAALVQVDELPTYAAIETGEFAPETRPFDLYQLVHGAVAALRPQAADRGTALTVRIDPRLPYELRGWPHQLRQLLMMLVAGALRGSERAAIAVHLDLVELAGDTVHLRVAAREQGGRVVPGAAARGNDPALAAAARLATAMGGRFARAGTAKKGLELTAELPFTLDRAAAALLLDLDRLPVLIMTGDSGFAAELAASLRQWRAIPSWIGTGDGAFAHVEALMPDAQRPALIVDGRDDVLSGLSWAHRAGRANPTAAPYVLFVAAEARIDSVIGLADGVLDAILSAPFTPGVLQSTLHALRVGTADWFPAEPLPAPVIAPEPPPAGPVARDEAAIQLPAEPPPAPPPVRRGPPQILVAATNAMNRKIIEQILMGARCMAHLVADADQALDMLAARPIDLILVDFAAGTIDDAAAVERLHEVHPGVPIFVLSGDPDPEAAILFAGAGAASVLGKPLEPSRLIAAIDLAVPHPPPPAPPPPAPPPPEAPPAPAVVTEISSHPRFGRPAGPIDRRAVDALVLLGGDSAFFADLIEAFRTDARQIMRELGGAAAIGDARGFNAAVQALRSCSASLGGTGLRELLLATQDIDAAEFPTKGVAIVQEIAGEITRLEQMLAEYRKTAE